MPPPPTEWKTVHELKGSDGIVVRVQRRGDYRPQYSVQAGRERRPEPGEAPTDRLIPFTPVRMLPSGKVDRQVEDLMRRCHDWIELDASAFVPSGAPPERRPRTPTFEEESSFVSPKSGRGDRRNGDRQRKKSYG